MSSIPRSAKKNLQGIAWHASGSCLVHRLIHAWPWVRSQAERGEDEVFEFTVAIVPLTILILMIAFASVVRASQMPAWTAASECARAAIATEDQSLGRQQALRAAMGSLEGNYISLSSSVQVDITGDWTPDSPITCRVSYNIDVTGIGFFAELTGGQIPIAATVTLRTEPYKSRWQ